MQKIHNIYFKNKALQQQAKQNNLVISNTAATESNIQLLKQQQQKRKSKPGTAAGTQGGGGGDMMLPLNNSHPLSSSFILYQNSYLQNNQIGNLFPGAMSETLKASAVHHKSKSPNSGHSQAFSPLKQQDHRGGFDAYNLTAHSLNLNNYSNGIFKNKKFSLQ
jgi:hypothetical protein